MSINQQRQFLRNAPLASVTWGADHPYVYYFIYDHHYNLQEFRDRFPSSLCIGIARLPNWIWHINQQGVPNIRRPFVSQSCTYLNNTRFVLPSTASTLSIPRGTEIYAYGYLFRVPLVADRLVHTHLERSRLPDGRLGSHRIRTVQSVEYIFANMQLGRLSTMDAVVYWDPRNTVSSPRNAMADEVEKAKWVQGVNMMRRLGLGGIQVCKIIRHLMGKNEDVEPLAIAPAALHMGMGTIDLSRDDDGAEIEERLVHDDATDVSEGTIMDDEDCGEATSEAPPSPRPQMIVVLKAMPRKNAESAQLGGGSVTEKGGDPRKQRSLKRARDSLHLRDKDNSDQDSEYRPERRDGGRLKRVKR